MDLCKPYLEFFSPTLEHLPVMCIKNPDMARSFKGLTGWLTGEVLFDLDIHDQTAQEISEDWMTLLEALSHKEHADEMLQEILSQTHFGVRWNTNSQEHKNSRRIYSMMRGTTIQIDNRD